MADIRCGHCHQTHNTVAQVRSCAGQGEPTQAPAPDIFARPAEPIVPKVKARQAPAVAAGRYAIELDGTLHFFKIDRPAEGRWAGRTFVTEQAGSDSYPVRGSRMVAVIEAVAADAHAAMLRYGQQIGSCGVCGRPLTDEASRAAGIGPICAERMGG